jgi:ribonuclease HI
MAPKGKYYVVWDGRAPGIYETWEDCKDQVEGFPGARYRAYPDQDSATQAFRGNPADEMALYRAMATHSAKVVNYAAFPQIRLDAIAVDAACSRNPGPVEYQGVMVGTGEVVFKIGPLEGGTNNIGEYLAIIHAAALFKKNGDFNTPIYSDSRTALSWIRAGHSRTSVKPTANNARIVDMLRRADLWLSQNRILNPIIKWETEEWGEIPADFGRK